MHDDDRLSTHTKAMEILMAVITRLLTDSGARLISPTPPAETPAQMPPQLTEGSWQSCLLVASLLHEVVDLLTEGQQQATNEHGEPPVHDSERWSKSVATESAPSASRPPERPRRCVPDRSGWKRVVRI